MSLGIGCANATLHEIAHIEFVDELDRLFIPVKTHWLNINNFETVFGSPLIIFFNCFINFFGKFSSSALDVVD